MKIFITNKIPHYREFLFRDVLQGWEIILTDNSDWTLQFKGILKSFYITRIWQLDLAKCDEIVMPFNIRDLSLIYLSFSRHRKKLKIWGIGVKTEPNWKTGDSLLSLRRFLVRRSKATLLYYDAAKSNYLGIDDHKLFVLNNTIEHFKSTERPKIVNRDSYFLVIGTITKLKGLEDILSVYSEYVKRGGNFGLKIVGAIDKEVDVECRKIVFRNSFKDMISFEGIVEDEETKSNIFASAVATLFYNQAGLGVIESLMYSTPVIAKAKCITGGEVFAVRSEFNGYLIENDEEYVQRLIHLTKMESLRVMQENARKTYLCSYRPQQTVSNFSRFLCY